MKRLILFVVVLSYSISLIAQSANLQVKQKPLVLQNAKPEAAGFSAERLKRIDKNINEYRWLTGADIDPESVRIDKNGNLWFGTKFVGLSKYDGKTFTTFSQYDN